MKNIAFQTVEKPAFKVDNKTGELKPTKNITRIYPYFLLDPKKKQSGADIRQLTGLSSGVVYPLLQGLEEKGWLQSEWEDIEPALAGRPARKYYWPTKNGIQHGHKIFNTTYSALRDYFVAQASKDLCPT